VSCFFGHKWGKWEVFTKDMIYLPNDNRPPMPYTERTQRRVCERCGKIQEQEL
jgi:hypothetical protein